MMAALADYDKVPTIIAQSLGEVVALRGTSPKIQRERRREVRRHGVKLSTKNDHGRSRSSYGRNTVAGAVLEASQ